MGVTDDGAVLWHLVDHVLGSRRALEIENPSGRFDQLDAATFARFLGQCLSKT